MTKGLVKSSKKKQRLNEKFLKDRNPKKELNYEQYETFFNSLKKKSKKKYYSDLIDSYKYNIKKTWDAMKEIIGKKRVTNAPLSIFITVKNREIFDKEEIAAAFNNCPRSERKQEMRHLGSPAHKRCWNVFPAHRIFFSKEIFLTHFKT